MTVKLVTVTSLLIELNPHPGGGWGPGHYRVGRRAWKVPSGNHTDVRAATREIAKKTQCGHHIHVLDVSSGSVWTIEGELDLPVDGDSE